MPEPEVGRYIALLRKRPRFDDITGDDFQAFLEVYWQHISNPMRDLDTFRFEKMPAACALRDPKYLDRRELIHLAQWV